MAPNVSHVSVLTWATVPSPRTWPWLSGRGEGSCLPEQSLSADPAAPVWPPAALEIVSGSPNSPWSRHHFDTAVSNM